MNSRAVLAQRLATQRLSTAPLPAAADAVRLLTAVQCQERDLALYSLGMRSRPRTLTAVKEELDAGAFVRTHVLRPTWHFVAPEDLRWLLELTSPRVEQSMGARHRQLGLDDSRVLGTTLEMLADLLRDKAFQTRKQLGDAFAERGSSIRAGEQLGHLLLVAELRGLICSGPTQGVHHTYALVDEVIAPARQPTAEEAHVELVRRFFAGHGPASIKDFTRWSSLTVAGTKAALAEIGDGLEAVEVDGTSLWFDPGVVPRHSPTARRSPTAPQAYLLPTYDEVILTYPTLNFPIAEPRPLADLSYPFWARVVWRGMAIGLWKRSITARAAEVEVRLSAAIPRQARDDVHTAAMRLATFLERELVFTESQPTAPDDGA